MAEEIESERVGPQRATEVAAWHLLGAASREKADAFLEEQIGVSRLEKEKLAKEHVVLDAEIAFNLSHLRLRRISDYARVSLEVAGFLVVLLVISGLGTMVWLATQDRDLVVDAFAVPPDMAQTGMTGAALANRVLDRFGYMDRHVVSFTEDFSSYYGSAKEDVRVEIPQTGVSLGDIDRYLRAWLGHETHVTGELVRTKAGLSLTVRYGDNPGLTADGPADDLDKLIQKGAENIFRAAQPLRFADYLSWHGRLAEAEGIATAEAQKDDGVYRSRAFMSLGYVDVMRGDNRKLGVDGAQAIALDPNSPLAWFMAEASANNLSHDEQDLAAAKGFLSVAKGAANEGGKFASSLPAELQAGALEDQGDLLGAVQACERLPSSKRIGACNTANLIFQYATLHDFRRGREIMRVAPSALVSGRINIDFMVGQAQFELLAGDWNRSLVQAKKAEAAIGSDAYSKSDVETFLKPYEAEALARAGDIKTAHAMSAKSPLDCDVCLRERGRIAAIAHDWTGAAHWFAIVSARSPHIPFADTEWGGMLMREGKYDAAIAKFKLANQKGPHFADPLEMWGEALMQKNRSDLALAKFKEAAKYAPSWGRLHLEWGNALFYAGRSDEAKKQIAMAAGLDLSPDDRALLAKWMKAHG